MSSYAILPVAIALCLAGCGRQPDINRIEANGAAAAENAIGDADDRAELLTEQSQLLNNEAGRATGARRQALQNEANGDLSAAVNIVQSGQTDAAGIEANTAQRIDAAGPH